MSASVVVFHVDVLQLSSPRTMVLPNVLLDLVGLSGLFVRDSFTLTRLSPSHRFRLSRCTRFQDTVYRGPLDDLPPGTPTQSPSFPVTPTLFRPLHTLPVGVSRKARSHFLRGTTLFFTLLKVDLRPPTRTTGLN